MKTLLGVLAAAGMLAAVVLPGRAAADPVTVTGTQCSRANTDYVLDIAYDSAINGGEVTLQTNYETRRVLRDDGGAGYPVTVSMKARSDATGFVRLWFTYVAGEPPITISSIVCR